MKSMVYMNCRRMCHLAMLTVAVLACGDAARATTWYVKTDGSDGAAGTNWATAFQTISNGVANAIAGESVLVSNGTYNVSNQISVTLGITVQGVGGASNTFVRGGYPATTNRLFSITDPNAVVDGFTITNGWSLNDHGGGVKMSGGTLTNCVVASCSVTNDSTNPAVSWQAFGGGVYMTSGQVVNCTIRGNWARGNYQNGDGDKRDGGGGGIYMTNNGGTYLTALAANCLIVSNNAHRGGGVYVTYGTVSNCDIRQNLSLIGYNNGMYAGGGGACLGASGTVVFCSIVSNRCDTGNSFGGGVYVSVQEAGLLANCRILYNQGSQGGGVYSVRNTFMRNCLLARNTSSGDGGGAFAGCNVQNCTIAFNTASGFGGGITKPQDGSVLSVKNSIIYLNTAPVWSNAWKLVGGNWTNFYSDVTCSNIPGPGAIEADPLFVNAATNDYRLQLSSPCMNTGSNELWMTDAMDLAGKPRLFGTVDMGAYEFPRTIQGTVFVVH